jgi:hypothetical protein
VRGPLAGGSSKRIKNVHIHPEILNLNLNPYFCGQSGFPLTEKIKIKNQIKSKKNRSRI